MIGSADHARRNLEMARESIVLLRNNAVLPFADAGELHRIAVVGPLADDAQNQLGDWAIGRRHCVVRLDVLLPHGTAHIVPIGHQRAAILPFAAQLAVQQPIVERDRRAID